VVRIPIEKDRRMFTPIARSTYAFDRIYKGRTAVERINSRIDNILGFEFHYIMGKPLKDSIRGNESCFDSNVSYGGGEDKKESRRRYAFPCEANSRLKLRQKRRRRK
jgi:hypothetical protein